MKTILLLAHDPGGFDVISPVARMLSLHSIKQDFFCIGPAAKLDPLHATEEEQLFLRLRELLEGKQLGLLVTGTSWGSDAELRVIQFVKSYHIPTMSIIDYWTNYRLRFIKNGEIILPDYYVLMDNLARQEAIEEGIPQEIVRVLGHPGLDVYSELRSHHHNVQETDCSKKILFLSQPLSNLYGMEFGYNEFTVLDDLLSIVSNIVDASFNIKFHPKDEPQLKQKYNDFSVEGPLSELLLSHNLIIGMNSMSLLHSVLLGRSTISYQPNLAAKDVCITTKLGITELILSKNDLLELMHNPCLYEPKEWSQEQLNEYIWMDGQSTNRICRFIQEVIQEHED